MRFVNPFRQDGRNDLVRNGLRGNVDLRALRPVNCEVRSLGAFLQFHKID